MAAHRPSPRPAPLQLDQWSNTKAPLTGQQRTSVNRLADWLHRNSAEYKVSLAAESSQSRGQQSANHDDPDAAGEGEPGPSNHHAGQASTSTSTVSLPDAAAPLASAQDFLAWFTALSASITSATQTSHQRALADVAASTEAARSLLSQLESCQINVSELRAGSAFVEDSSRDLRDEAQALLDSQLHLDGLSDEIVSRLSFFTLLPYATAMLSSPDASVVHSQDFLDLLDQLDMALIFLQQDPARTYKDAALYRMRYAQCVTRGATLAKLAVCREFKEAGDDLVQRVKGTAEKKGDKGKGKASADDLAPIPAELADALFPERTSLVTKLRPLIHELERRAYAASTETGAGGDNDAARKASAASSNAAEFESLLDECRAAYFAVRRPLLNRLVIGVIAEIESTAFAASVSAAGTGSTGAGEGLQGLSTRGLATVRWFVERELDSYRDFFAPVPGRSDLDADPLLKAYLQSFIEVLQNRIRPRILKETRTDALARVCRVFVEPPSRSDDDRESEAGSGHDAGRSDSTLQLSHLLLHEAQLRLIFRAQAVISNDVGGFAPKEDQGHLDFPEAIEAVKGKMSGGAATLGVQRAGHHQRGKSGAGLLDAAMASSSASGFHSGRSGAHVRLFKMLEGSRSSYYPPLLALVDLLDELQGLIAPRAFRELAHEGVESCRKAVERGADLLVKRKKGGVEREDGLLFRIRQYEILREVVVSVDLASKQSASRQGEAGSGGAIAANTAAEADAQAALIASSSRSLVDLSSLTGAINSLWSSTGRLLYPASSADATPPGQGGSLGDGAQVNAALEATLRSTIDALAQGWSDAITLPLRVFVDTHAKNPAGADAERVESTLSALRTCIESVAEEKGEKVRLWIEDDEVKRGLLEILVQKVLLRYVAFESFVGQAPGEAGRLPRSEEVAEDVRSRFGGTNAAPAAP